MKIGFFGLLTLLVIVEECRSTPSTTLLLEQILETVKKIENLVRETTRPNLYIATPIALKRQRGKEIDAIHDNSAHQPRVPSNPKPPATVANTIENSTLRATKVTNLRDGVKHNRKRLRAKGNANVNSNTNAIVKKPVTMNIAMTSLPTMNPEISTNTGVEGAGGTLGKDRVDRNVNENVNTNVIGKSRILSLDEDGV